MTNNNARKKSTKKPPMKPFYFQHTQDMYALAQKMSAEENVSFPIFCRSVFNAGFHAKYGMKVVNNSPVTEAE